MDVSIYLPTYLQRQQQYVLTDTDALVRNFTLSFYRCITVDRMI